MKRLVLLFLIITSFTSCEKDQPLEDFTFEKSCTLKTIKGCEVLVCHYQKSEAGYYGYGFMSMVKQDCDCKFKEPIIKDN